MNINRVEKLIGEFKALEKFRDLSKEEDARLKIQVFGDTIGYSLPTSLSSSVLKDVRGIVKERLQGKRAEIIEEVCS